MIALAAAVILAAAPMSPLCVSSGAYRAAHPLICDTGTSAAPGQFPGGGGGGGGGLLGLIGLGGLL